MWEFPKIRGTFLGVPIIRIIVYWGSILGSPYFGKLPYGNICYGDYVGIIFPYSLLNPGVFS